MIHHQHAVLFEIDDGWCVCRDIRDAQLVVYPPPDGTGNDHFPYQYVYTADGLLTTTAVQVDSEAVIPMPPLVLAKLYELVENNPKYQPGARFDFTEELRLHQH